jgi:hypothetical protein
VPFRFDTALYYPFGSNGVEGSSPKIDVVYRPVPVYNESVRRQIMQSIASGAITRRSSSFDVEAGVPKAPVVRQLFVDAVTGDPIGEYKWLKNF